MIRSISREMLLVVAIVALVCGSATAAQKDKPGTPVRPGNKVGSAKWDYTLVDENNKVVQKGVFFARNSLIINRRGKKVGTYEDVSETYVKVDVDEGHLKGKIELRRDQPTTPAWTGELERPNGGKYKITVTFEKMK
jgi:hypothetical protein